MRVASVFLLVVATVAALAEQDVGSRIFGGTVTTINQYPYSVSLQIRTTFRFLHQCGGTIINNRSILTAGHCVMSPSQPSSWRGRVGSTLHQSGGTLHNFQQFIRHPNHIPPILNADIALIRIQGTFRWIQNTVQAASIAGPNYHLADNQPVWAVGWGVSEHGGLSNQLRHVQLWTINQNTCRQRWMGTNINNSMMCAGRLDVAGFGQCRADSGGPVVHNGVIVGVTSFGSGTCGHQFFPVVNARVSYVSNWVRATA